MHGDLTDKPVDLLRTLEREGQLLSLCGGVIDLRGAAVLRGALLGVNCRAMGYSSFLDAVRTAVFMMICPGRTNGPESSRIFAALEP